MSRSLPRRLFARFRWTGIGGLALAALAGCGHAPSGPAVEEVLPSHGGETPYGNFLAGRHAFNVQDMDAAADFMMLALEQDPRNIDILRRAYILTALDGRMAVAIDLSRRLVADMAGEPMPVLTLALDSARQDHWAEAKKAMGQMPQGSVRNLVSPLINAWLDLGAGDAQSALSDLAQVKNTNGLGTLYELHAALIGELALRPVAEIEAHYRAALAQTEGGSFRVIALYGNFLERQGRAGDAKALYESNASIGPLDQVLARIAAGNKPEPMVADAHAGLAESLFGLAAELRGNENTGDFALLLGRLALYVEPQMDISQMLVADALESGGRKQDAIKVYDAIAKDSPFRWSAQLRVAGLLDAIGQTDKAIALLGSMAGEKKSRPDAEIALADLLRVHERFAEAVTAYDEAIGRLGPLKKRDWTLLYLRGLAESRSGQWSRAQADFLHALQLEPNQPNVLNDLAYSWVDQGQNLDQAKALIERAAQLRPEDGFIVDSLGWVLFRTGHYQEAVHNLERAVALRPQDPIINAHLGDAYWRVGRKDEARFQWHTAISLKPDPENLAMIQGKLAKGLDSAK